MSKTRLFAAAALAAAALTSTAALAQDITPRTSTPNRGYNALNNYEPGYGRYGYRYGWHEANSGFWPLDAAVGIASGAVGTAGAIASAPFNDGRYAYNAGYGCQPGAWVVDGYGRRVMCQ